jgi:hypothetical protein
VEATWQRKRMVTKPRTKDKHIETDCAVALAVMMRSIITILGLSALLNSVAAYGEIF